MQPKINYHYVMPFKFVNHYDFIKYNDIVDETCYRLRVLPLLPTMIDILQKNPGSRNALIMTNDNLNHACLLSVQFLVVNKRVITIANFRSECAINGRPHDTEMLQYFSSIMMKGLRLKRYKIYVNVNHYHENKGIENNYGQL